MDMWREFQEIGYVAAESSRVGTRGNAKVGEPPQDGRADEDGSMVKSWTDRRWFGDRDMWSWEVLDEWIHCTVYILQMKEMI
jgi:hypothetical protein